MGKHQASGWDNGEITEEGYYTPGEVKSLDEGPLAEGMGSQVPPTRTNQGKPSRVAYRYLMAASSYRGDPYWMKARYPGKADDGTAFRRGEEVLYWPRTKSFMVGQKAKDAWQRFRSEVEDEDAYNRYASLKKAYHWVDALEDQIRYLSEGIDTLKRKLDDMKQSGVEPAALLAVADAVKSMGEARFAMQRTLRMRHEPR